MGTGSVRQALDALNLEPLWERSEGGLRPRPEPIAPQIWRWADIEPLLDDIIASVPMDRVDRRVLTLKNPDPRHRLTTTTRSINCGIQILMPGETAPPHRHSPNALRVVLEGEGGATTVNGIEYGMERGDVILTPSWTSHAHLHHGTGRVVWIDFLDVPLYRNFDLVFFEIDRDDTPAENAEAPTVGRVHSGPLPVGRFPWEAVAAELAEAAPGGDGARIHDYLDPTVGDAALPTLDCRAIALPPGEATTASRSSANAVCLVLDGEGETEIDGEMLSWRRNDLFTLPHWSWVSHRPAGDGATLMAVSDRPALRRLGLLQENSRP